MTHVYGLTEVYGPVTVCAWKSEWDELPLDDRAKIKARQGVRYHTLAGTMVGDPNTMEAVPKDGKTIGEIFLRGNTVMKGYLKNPKATEEAFRGGWFHTGDLAVMHEDGYMEIKDRLKDIIISGGERTYLLLRLRTRFIDILPFWKRPLWHDLMKSGAKRLVHL